MTKIIPIDLTLVSAGLLMFLASVPPATAQSPERDLSVSFSTKHESGADAGFAMGTVTNKSATPYPCVSVELNLSTRFDLRQQGEQARHLGVLEIEVRDVGPRSAKEYKKELPFPAGVSLKSVGACEGSPKAEVTQRDHRAGSSATDPKVTRRDHRRGHGARTEIRSFGPTNVSDAELHVTVAYTYAGQVVPTGAYVQAFPLESDGVYDPRTVDVNTIPLQLGDNRVLIRIVKRSSGRDFRSEEIRVCLTQPQRAILCKNFPFTKSWQNARPGDDVQPGSGSAGPPTVIDFEDLEPRTRVTTQYVSRGVRFTPSAYLDSDAKARSGGRALRAADPGSEFHSAPMVMEFSSGQQAVSFWAGSMHSPTQGTLTAFDAGGLQLDRDGPKAVGSGGFTTRFEVTAGAATIRKVVLQYASTGFESIDDLELRGEAVGMLPTQAPDVRIDSPTNLDVSVGSITLSGTVSGEGVLSSALVKVETTRPPGSFAPTTSTGSLSLAGSGTTRTFSQPRTLEIGPQTLTISAENTGGLTGSAEVTVVYYPPALRARMALEGSGNLGSFVFGGSTGASGCVYAVFRQAAVAARGGQSFVVRGEILDRWLADEPSNGYPTLGCPIGEERHIAGDAATAQDFESARLYSDPGGTYKVPPIFVGAIDALGGEAVIGIPVEDTSRALGAVSIKTELFQRFRRPGRQEPEATLEIRTTHGQPPPRLYVEYRANLPGFDVPAAFSPTIVHEFACEDLGTCEVAFAAEDPLPDIGRFCNHKTFAREQFFKDALLGEVTDLDLDPPEWVAIVGDHVQTPLRGLITTAGLSVEDNPFTHEFPEDCPAPGTGTTECLSWASGVGETCCPSDWHINVAPLPGWRGLLGVGAGSSDSYRDKMPVEYESRHARFFHTGTRDPAPGLLLFASGRWIVDCGHDYKTEIHPPSILALMETAPLEGKTATLASVWVAGFYSGDPVSFVVDPPPRPSPEAVLNVRKEADNPLDVTVADTFVDGQRLRLSFAASPRQVEITDAGEMKWQTGRGYRARYWVYWD